MRRRYYERHPDARRRLRQPVISVGNLSVGGTAKTPLVASIARHLLDRGEAPAILSRGYGRTDRADGVVVVSDGRRVFADVARAGDEPLMLAHALHGARVVVSEDRHLAGRLAERQLGATVHILDDGFQHVQLARDLDILMTRVGEASGRVLPFGRLRESPDAAARAHFAVVLDADLATARTEAWSLGVSACAGARRVLQATHPVESPVVAVAGIAQPEQFFQMLTEAGYEIARTLAFADHHPYRSPDIARIAAAVRDSSAATVVTTEKDVVRLTGLGSLPFGCFAVPMGLEIDGWEGLEGLDRGRARTRAGAGVRRQIEYLLVAFVRGLLRVLPHRIVHLMGATVGWVFYTVDRGHRRVALANLAQCFPKRSPRELRHIARRMFAHFGRLLFAMLKFSTLSHAEMLRRVEFEGEDRARHAYAQGRGVLFFTGHFGFWELHAIVHGAAAAADRRPRAGARQSELQHAARTRSARGPATA